MDILNATAIAEAAGPASRRLDFEVVESCDSTNARLLERAIGDRPLLLAAGTQTAARGRHGRRWHDPRGNGLAFSVAWRMRTSLAALSGLPLAAGVAAARALRVLGAAEVELKWPNDLVARGAKLGGILVETKAPGDDGPLAVIGIGINCRASGRLSRQLRRPLIALEALLRPLPERNLIAGRIAASLAEAIDAFEARGLEPLRAEWEALHAHAGRRLRLRLPGGRVITGTAEGIAADGALRLRTRQGIQAFHAARVVNARAAAVRPRQARA